MNENIPGKVVAITGASSGLGETDVTDREQVKRLVDTAVQSFGRQAEESDDQQDQRHKQCSRRNDNQSRT